MEALNFFKLCTPINESTGAPAPFIEVDHEEEDSFFDLELSVTADGEKQSILVGDQQKPPTYDVFSKRKIIPIDPSPSLTSTNPKSPISSLKSKNPNGVTPVSLTGVNGSKSEKKQSSGREQSLSDSSVSKRFAKITIQKYFNRIKPRKNTMMSMFSCSPMAFPMASPPSSPAKVGVVSPAKRNDCPIQSAILHCKRSFNSSSESSMLSRSSSVSSDCSVFSRFCSDQWIDSGRNSVDEGYIIFM